MMLCCVLELEVEFRERREKGKVEEGFVDPFGGGRAWGKLREGGPKVKPFVGY